MFCKHLCICDTIPIISLEWIESHILRKLEEELPSVVDVSPVSLRLSLFSSYRGDEFRKIKQIVGGCVFGGWWVFGGEAYSNLVQEMSPQGLDLRSLQIFATGHVPRSITRGIKIQVERV